MSRHEREDATLSRGFEAVLFDSLALPSDHRWWVAYSGGLDSSVLLHLVMVTARHVGIEVVALHANHGLQPQAAAWQAHCERLCAARGIPLHTQTLTLATAGGHGLEAQARAARYRWFAQKLGPGEVLLTAHHRDDQAETLFLNLLRGTGVSGLRGIHPRRPFGRGILARPLLEFARTEIADYARRHNLKWVDDHSNRDTRHARNYLRHRLMPLLQERWPRAADSLARTSRHMADTAAILDDLARDDLELAGLELGGHSLRAPALAQLPAGRVANALRYWLSLAGVRSPSTEILRQLQALVATDARDRRISWSRWVVRRYRDRLYLECSDDSVDANVPADRAWDLAAALPLPELGLRLVASRRPGRGLAGERLSLPLRVTWRKGGELCRLPGRRHRQQLKKLLQASGVPPWKRSRIPLIYSGDELAAVVGHWYCAPFAAADDELGWVIEIESGGSN